jgi:hypothetical protein
MGSCLSLLPLFYSSDLREKYLSYTKALQADPRSLSLATSLKLSSPPSTPPRDVNPRSTESCGERAQSEADQAGKELIRLGCFDL